jgi:ABC-type antimicrobial peptide transport system permease subunit
MAFLPFVLRRAGRHWQLILTLILGTVLASALMASGPLLVNSVIEMGLYLTLQSSSVPDGNLRLSTSAHVDREYAQQLDNDLQATLRSALGEHVDVVVPTARSDWFYPWTGGRVMEDYRVNLLTYDGIEDRIEFLAGTWPQQVIGEDTVIRVVVSEGMGRSFTLRVGDRIPLSRSQDSGRPEAWVEVAGIARPRDPRSRYWFGEYSPFAAPSTERWTAQYSMIVPQEAFFRAASSLLLEEQVDLAWHAFLRRDRVSATDIEPLQGQLDELREELASLRAPVEMETGIPRILSRFQRQLDSIRAPLYIFVAEVMLLVLYYVTMVAALSIRQVEREFSILRSRGTTSWQIARIQLVEALIILAIALVSGPWVGTALVRGLSWIGPLADLGTHAWDEAHWLSGSIHQSFWAAAAGTFACLGALMLPLRPALRRSIVIHQRMMARRSRPPWWQRYYLDLFALLVGLILLWRLRLYGEMVTGGPGGARLDWLLLLSPVAFLLGTATILLLVFPLLLRAMAARASRAPGLVGALALWQTSRDPTHVTRLVLLLTLAVALSNLSTGLNITLDQSETDRATYLAGNDRRIASQQAVPLLELGTTPGVLELSGVWRGDGRVVLESTQSYPSFEVLAIEPDSFGMVTRYRDDFADERLEKLVENLAIPEGEHPSLLLLPGQPAALGLMLWGSPEDKGELDSYQRWIDGYSDAERVGVRCKLQTNQGELFTISLLRPKSVGQPTLQTDRLSIQMQVGGRDVGMQFNIRPDNQGWTYFEGTVPVLPTSAYPLSLHSIWFQNQATRLGEPIAKQSTIVLDELSVIDAIGQDRQIVEDFEDPERTIFLNIMDGDSIHVGLYTQLAEWSFGAGRWGQVVSMTFPRPYHAYPLRLRQTWTVAPLPAIASPAFIASTELGLDDLVRTQIEAAEIDFRIVGTTRYFPTMYEEQEAGFLVTSRDLLLAKLNDTVQLSTNPNEVLIETDGSTPIDALANQVPMLSASWEAENVRQTLKANPLALGLRGVTFFGSALTILLSLVGFATHFYLTVRQRDTLYGVMRAMGMSPRQLYAWIVVEQAVLILAGLILGTGLGVLLNQITLPRLPVSLGDRPPVPPFVPKTDWLAISELYLVLAVAFIIILSIVTALLWRARVHRVLRIGQE